MTRTTVSIPGDLRERVDRERADEVKETGEMPSRSEMVKRALDEFLEDGDDEEDVPAQEGLA